MNTYIEYPIRCKTCNELVACFSDEFVEQTKILGSMAEALDNMGITAPCTRSAFCNPTYVLFNMENRAVIEGMIQPENANDVEEFDETQSNPTMIQCLNTNRGFGFVLDKPTEGIPILSSNVLSPNANLGILLPVQNITSIPNANIEVHIENTEPENFSYTEPSIPGIPTINENNSIKPVMKYVGSGKYSKVLTGRTYLIK